MRSSDRMTPDIPDVPPLQEMGDLCYRDSHEQIEGNEVPGTLLNTPHALHSSSLNTPCKVPFITVAFQVRRVRQRALDSPSQ